MPSHSGEQQGEHKAGGKRRPPVGPKEVTWDRDLIRGKEPGVGMPGKEHVIRVEAQPSLRRSQRLVQDGIRDTSRTNREFFR